MSEHNTDIIIIGMGPGGESVGGQLGEAGLNVIGIEANLCLLYTSPSPRDRG